MPALRIVNVRKPFHSYGENVSGEPARFQRPRSACQAVALALRGGCCLRSCRFSRGTRARSAQHLPPIMTAALKATTHSLRRRRSLVNAPACGHASTITSWNGNDGTPMLFYCSGFLQWKTMSTGHHSDEAAVVKSRAAGRPQELNDTRDSAGPLSTSPRPAAGPAARDVGAGRGGGRQRHRQVPLPAAGAGEAGRVRGRPSPCA